jgi:hypothetical protein
MQRSGFDKLYQLILRQKINGDFKIAAIKIEKSMTNHKWTVDRMHATYKC